MPPRLAERLIGRALRTPYFHLYHADGSLYMERYWLRSYSAGGRWAARVHHIATPDLDRHMHDHPWDFVSIVLRGGYKELRPLSIDPAFDGDEERSYLVDRRPGSIVLRLSTDRHRVVDVLPDTWTLFITGPKRQWWGFHTETGKVHWRDYESVHNKTERA
jgi:hypothetical protein